MCNDNAFRYKNLKKKVFLVTTVIFLIIVYLAGNKVYASIGNKKHPEFEFAAAIKNNEIVDGTAPFDNNNDPGYDNGAHNGIVRTFDTITYPVKVTINPKSNEKIQNIKLKLSGSLKNGITNGRVNAKFSIGGKELLEKQQVTFEQIYTVKQTGNSIMIPVNIEVKGAEHGVILTPKIKIEVLSVDGVDVSKDNILREFNNLPGVKTSGKVNIKPKLSNGYTGEGIGAISYTAVDSKCTDESLLYQMGVSFGVTSLNGKSDLKGATFPTGKINYHFELSGFVEWDDSKIPNAPLNFKGKDTALTLFDYQDISRDNNRTGHDNTLSKDLGSYSHRYNHKHNIAQSKITNINDYKVIEKESPYTVWNSGQYKVEKQKVASDKVIFKGTVENYIIGSTFPEYRADGWRGAKVYSTNEKAFSTQAFLFKSANEYIDLGKNNKQGKPNNVYYKVKVYVDSYKDSKGNNIPLSAYDEINMTERNNTKGAYSTQTTFHSYPSGKELGTPYKGYDSVSKGDTSIVIGEDVKIKSVVNASVFTPGGGMAVVKWNIDTFHLTKEYSDIALKNIYSYGYMNGEGRSITNDYNNQKVQFGVPKNKDMSFEKLTRYGKDDYAWFNTYDEAVKNGKIGAIKNDVRTMLGSGTIFRTSDIPLKVISKKIGSKNEKGTYNITATQCYMYRDKERKVCIEFRKEGYNNPSFYNSEGELTKLQSPVGRTINFETLAVLNSKVSSNITTEKETYYNSEVINWKVESSLVIPPTNNLNQEDNNFIEIKQVLNKGLTYVMGSGVQGANKVEPKIKKLNDGRMVLTWIYRIPADNKLIPDIKYSTQVNPYALSNESSSSVEITSIISSPLDSRKEHLRTNVKRVTITKVGMVGIWQDILELYGGKNSEYVLDIMPYTTIEDEKEVKGISMLPYDGDKLGSKFSGTTFLKSITINTNKKVEIWLNNRMINTNPNKVDLKTDGWYKYDPSKNQNLANTKTVFFHIPGVLESKDKVSLRYTMGTNKNNFGDSYCSETLINSSANYKLSPLSRVKYTIRANSEIELEQIRIYTDKFTKGLPVEININKDILVESSKDEKVDINLYEKETGKYLTGRAYTIDKLPKLIKHTIPSKFLEKDKNITYEARIEGHNKDVVYAISGKEKVDTKGYTASEKTVEANDMKDAELYYKGVVMTERKVGCEMKTYYESLSIPLSKPSKIKSGYGLEAKYSLKYHNDLKKYKPIEAKLMLDPSIIDSTLNLKKENKFKRLDLNEKSNTFIKDDECIIEYELPQVVVEVGSGNIYLQEETKELVMSKNNLLDGGKKIYIPVWIDKLGSYEMKFQNQGSVGVNLINFDVCNHIEVYAYMYGTMGSKTIKKDELLLQPIYPDSTIPNGWNEKELNWLKK